MTRDLARTQAAAGPERASRRPPAAPATAILDLQRTAGNRALRGILQRKVGFEAELSVNVFRSPQERDLDHLFRDRQVEGIEEEEHEGHDEVPESCPWQVVDFLIRGLPYANGIDKTQHFVLKADHNRAVNESVKGLLAALEEEGWAPKPDQVIQKDNAPSILEYASEPIDELEPGSTAKFHATIDAVLTHMKGVLGARPGEEVSEVKGKNPAWTGIPVRELQHWLGKDVYDEYAKPAVERIRNAMGDKLDIQVTAGIIPSALPELYEREAKTGTAAQGETDGGRIGYGILTGEIHAGVNALFADEQFKTHAFFDKLSSTDKDALKGLVALGYSYVVGDAWMQTGVNLGVDKNAVPFFLQMRWDKFRKEGGPPGLARIPESLVGIIGSFLAQRPFAKQQDWLDQRLKMEQLPKRVPIPSFVFGKGGVRAFFADILGDAPKIKFWHNELPGDTQRDPVQKESKESLGIPLERRYVQIVPDEDKKHTTSDLRKVVMGFVDEARQLNTRNLKQKAEARKALLDAADGKPASEQPLSQPAGTD
jgi:hypothetical protein